MDHEITNIDWSDPYPTGDGINEGAIPFFVPSFPPRGGWVGRSHQTKFYSKKVIRPDNSGLLGRFTGGLETGRDVGLLTKNGNTWGIFMARDFS